MNTTYFEVFKKAGRTYLLFPYDSQSVSVMDEDGNNYGSWYDKKSFLSHLEDGKATSLGKADLRLVARRL